jgi:hypothetical protein
MARDHPLIKRRSLGGNMKELPYIAIQRKAAERVLGILSAPPYEEWGGYGGFNPWDIFPCFYGTYQPEFDQVALDVLAELITGEASSAIFGDLAANMFKEALCKLDLCEYGTSPRVCFPTQYFAELLPKLNEEWHKYYFSGWGEKYKVGAYTAGLKSKP